jgi:hypothetical protein
VFLYDPFRGRLLYIPASLLFFLSGELLKRQRPVLAASEKLALISVHLRSIFLTYAPQLLRSYRINIQSP